MKNKGKMRIELPLAIIEFKPEGYVHLQFKKHSYTLDETEEIFNHIKEFSPWAISPLLISSDELTEHNKESQYYLYGENVALQFSAIGLITKSFLQKTMANLINKFIKHESETRFFLKEEKAFNWLRKFEICPKKTHTTERVALVGY